VEEVQISGIGTEDGRGTDRWKRYGRRKRYRWVEKGTEGGRGTDRRKRRME
jgi:hypothetical protein